MWQLKQIGKRKGNLYPTHGLGPVCQVMNINRGDKMDYMVSLSGNDFLLGEKAKKLASADDFYKPYVGKSYNGNMNTSIIRTEKGRTIMLQYDITSPRPYTRIQMISGTKAASQKYPLPGRISKGHEWATDEEYKVLEEKYTPCPKCRYTLIERCGYRVNHMLMEPPGRCPQCRTPIPGIWSF